MTVCARSRIYQPGQKGVFHCWNRCVRRARLLGKDPLTNKDYSHRRKWWTNRLEQLCGLFAIDVQFRAELSNHFHLMLRTWPRIPKRWGREEVARRWLTITRLAKSRNDSLPAPTQEQIEALAKDKKEIKRIQRRLSNISWFVGTLCENIARRANREDECTGKFFEDRFKCRECTDVNAILVCAMYIDLNQIRAGEARSLETSRNTSIYQRIQAEGQRRNAKDRVDGWLGELTLQPESLRDEALAQSSRTGRRASDLGILPIKLEDYRRLLEWTARQLRAGTRSTIPQDLDAILELISIQGDAWLDTVENLQATFGHVIGPADQMSEAASRMGVRCLKGTPAAARVFN